ncbi:MAG: asparagine synthase [Oscillospiraceae bacterium]|nr:asparagine synthase [Oscillospiraceae bacterium]
MVDKNYCMSSFLVFRYIVDDEKDFYASTKHQIYTLIPEDERILVWNEKDIDEAIEAQFAPVRGKKLGILLSGGMDSACLASYMQGCDAYTFRFLGGDYQKDELARAEYYAKKYGLTLHYVDISWDTVQANLEPLMKQKGAPVHSIEPQILAAAKQAQADGIEMMIIGDAADYVFAGMDGLHAKDWEFDEFVERYTYLDPKMVLENPVDMSEAFEKYRCGDKIDFITLMHEYADIESYASYENAFEACGMPFLDPYEILKMAEPLDLERIRNGESKYLVRALFKMKYPEIPVPQKLPMPRPVDAYFKTWEGPTRPEFKKNIDMSKLSGNQKWQLYCLERFLNLNEQ